MRAVKGNKKKKGGKRAIISDVMAKGFTSRKAEQGVNAVLNIWEYALWCGDPVQVPGGVLQAKFTLGAEAATLQRFQNIQTKEPMIRMVHTPGRRRVVKLRADPALIEILEPLPPPPPPLPPPPPPPKSETAEEIQERQLTTLLLKLRQPAADCVMATVRQAVGAHPRIPGDRLSYQPGALLRRLRQFRDRGWSFSSVSELAQQISEYCRL